MLDNKWLVMLIQDLHPLIELYCTTTCMLWFRLYGLRNWTLPVALIWYCSSIVKFKNFVTWMASFVKMFSIQIWGVIKNLYDSSRCIMFTLLFWSVWGRSFDTKDLNCGMTATGLSSMTMRSISAEQHSQCFPPPLLTTFDSFLLFLFPKMQE